MEIEPDTGETEVARYTIVDDFGVTLNPLLLMGQVHGGAAQGIGQALHERTVYDAGGQLVTARSWITACLAPRTFQTSTSKPATCLRSPTSWA